MNSLTVFDFEDRVVRSVTMDGAPWFVGKDVCQCLDIGNHRDALGRLDDDERRCCVGIADAMGRDRDTIVVSEAGVYRLVFTSRSEVAERFKRWLAHEVLPSIRRTGRYDAPAAPGVPATLEDDAIDDLHRKMMIIRECRLTFGTRSARDLARAMTLPMRVPERAGVGDDPVAAFADDALIREIGCRLSAGDLYATYARWCADRRISPVSATAFGRRMTGLGLGRLKSGGRVIYTDVDVAANQDASSPD